MASKSVKLDEKNTVITFDSAHGGTVWGISAQYI